MGRPFPRRAGRPERMNDDHEQPGFPPGEARLIDVREESGSVFLMLDEGSVLELAPDSVPVGLPGIGEIIPQDLLAEVRLAAERKQVARLVFSILDRRLHPVARIRDKAVEKGYSMVAVDAVLEQMAATGLYSDRRFAEAYCRDVLATRAVGRYYLVSKLREKRVSGTLATEVVDEILDPATEDQLADQAAASRWKKIRGTGDMKDVAKVVRHLQSRGFSAGSANRAARKMKPGVPEDSEDPDF